MAYEFRIFKCQHGCELTFWTLGDMYSHHFEQHERPVPEPIYEAPVIPPPADGVLPTAFEIARAGLAAMVTVNGTQG